MRLFIAVNFPAELRRDIWNVTEPLRSADLPVRWVDPEGMHLTLKFLGTTEPTAVAAIVQVLDGAVQGTRPFALPVEGFGVFPAMERPHVIWVGCEGIPPLELLQHRLEVGMESLGFPIEARTFRPHLTLGRVKKEARPASLRGLDRRLEAFSFQGEALVSAIDLMESVTGPHGSRYQVVHSAALQP